MSKDYLAVFGLQGSTHHRHSWHETQEEAEKWLEEAQEHVCATNRAAWPQPAWTAHKDDPRAAGYTKPVGRPVKGSDRKSQRIEFRCTGDELIAYTQAAYNANGAEGVLSDWIRDTLNKAAAG